MLYTGIDLHKRTSVLSTVDASGQIVAKAKLPNDRSALLSYFRQLPGPHQATVEATGSWYWLADLLSDEAVDLRLGHAKYLKAIAYAKVKTDAVDANTLAQLLRVEMIPEAHMISSDLRPIRDLMRARLRLVQKHVSARNSIHRLLEKYNVADVPDLPPLVQIHAQCFVDQCKLLKKQIKHIEQVLNPLLIPNDEVQRLLWIPGIGKIGAYTLHLEIDGIERFASDRKFFSYCRLVPGSDNSGGRQRHKSSKDGNRYLKIVFSHAALRAIQYFPEVRAFAQRKARSKGKHLTRALVAKEIARIVYHVMQSGQPFNGKFKGATIEKPKQVVWPRRANPG
ncbi:MAG TPA: IS110 family transposase [Longimicrobiales bacterium]